MYKDRMEMIRRVARETGWRESEHKEDQFMIRFRKADSIIDVWYSKMTVCTIVTHPTKGRGQMYQRGVFQEKDLKKLFMNPRAHTGERYYGGGQYLSKKINEQEPGLENIIDNYTKQIAENHALRIDQNMQVIVNKKPWWMPEWVYKKIIKNLLEIKIQK